MVFATHFRRTNVQCTRKRSLDEDCAVIMVMTRFIWIQGNDSQYNQEKSPSYDEVHAPSSKRLIGFFLSFSHRWYAVCMRARWSAKHMKPISGMLSAYVRFVCMPRPTVAIDAAVKVGMRPVEILCLL